MAGAAIPDVYAPPMPATTLGNMVKTFLQKILDITGNRQAGYTAFPGCLTGQNVPAINFAFPIRGSPPLADSIDRRHASAKADSQMTRDAIAGKPPCGGVSSILCGASDDPFEASPLDLRSVNQQRRASPMNPKCPLALLPVDGQIPDAGALPSTLERMRREDRTLSMDRKRKDLGVIN